MRARLLLITTILLASLVVAVPALADAPSTGIVEEGNSVPGIQLGQSRAQVEAAYGQYYYCQSYSIYDDNAYCTFPVSGGGLVSVRYRAADGSIADNSPNDRVVYIGWGEPVSGWTTTAGINTTLALANREAVAEAYPDAEVITNSGGRIMKVVDWLQGIEITWSFDGYTGTWHVYMNIFVPLSSLPAAQETHVQTIELSAYKERGLRRVNAWAEILTGYERAATGAEVHGTWILPDGSTEPAFEDFVGGTGIAHLQLIGKWKRGTVTLRIDKVVLDGHTFDRAGSQLSASVTMK